jgi:ribosomal protein S18 acetylase RimI-like enzyme
VNLEEEYGWILDGVEKYISEHPEEFIAHYGVKGMKWGVRNSEPSKSTSLKGLGPDEIVRKTSSGETLTLSKNPPSRLNKVFAKMSKNYVNSYNNGAFFTIKNGEGKKIGDANVWKKNDEELYLNWIGIKQNERGKGYATAVMKSAEEFGRRSGFKKMTLEVPTNSPDARHIYEKLGFKATKDLGYDPVWGGLTQMEYEFGEARHSIGDIPMSELTHYGAKGMKWGVRKAYTDSATKVANRYDRVASGKGSALDKTRTAVSASPTNLARGRGLKGAAGLMRDSERAHIDRVNNGEKKVRDVLAIIGRLNLTHVARGLNNARKYPD